MEDSAEEKIQKYWDNIHKKTDSVITILEGASYQEIKFILELVQKRVNSRLLDLVLY